MARRGWRVASALAATLLGLASQAHAADVKPPQAAPPPGDAVDAEMLRDLEVLNNPDYARDREIAKRMSFFERLRVLEAMRAANNQPPATGASQPGGPGTGR